MRCRHDMPFGAMLNRDGHAVWRLWAPSARSVELLLITDHGEPLAVPAGFCAHGSGVLAHQPYGSILRPRYWTPKCRCGPVAQPVDHAPVD